MTDTSSCDRASVQVASLVDSELVRVLELERKIENLELGMDSQRMIGVVIGLLAQRHQLSTEQAWELLRGLSQVTNIKVREVARILRESFDGVPRQTDAGTLAALRASLPDGSWGAGARSSGSAER